MLVQVAGVKQLELVWRCPGSASGEEKMDTPRNLKLCELCREEDKFHWMEASEATLVVGGC